MSRVINPGSVRRDSVQVSRSPLPAWAVDALHGEHRYVSNLGALAAVAIAYCNAGRTKHEFIHQAEGLAQLVARDDRCPSKATKALHRAWDYGQERAQVPPQFRGHDQVRQAVQAARERASLDRWGGQAGNSTRAVLEAVLVIAQERSTSTPALAVRTVAEHAGVGKSTAARGLARLVERGYLVMVKVAHYDQAATYRLTDRCVGGTGTAPYREGSVSQLFPLEPSRLAQYFASDAFAPGSPLGRTAARVLDALDELDALTPAQLSERLGLSTRCIRTALERLEAVGVAQRHQAGRGWAWTGRHDELNAQEIADAYGTTGTLARRADAFRAERNWYADRVEGFRARGLHRPRGAATGSLDRATRRIRADRALRVAS